MDEVNSRDIKSLYLNYDLNKNYLYGIEFKSLQEICILKIVVNSFKSDEAVQEITRIHIDQIEEETRNLFTIVEDNLPLQILREYLVKIRLTIRLVYNEIKRFLATIGLEDDKLLFVGYLVFNWQGGIDPRKTIQRVLNSNTLSIRGEFEFSCKYLFDEGLILTYFNNLKPFDINCYFRDHFNPYELHQYLICYWVTKFSEEHFIRPTPDHEQENNIKFFNYVYHNLYSKFILCTELAINYSFENIYDSSVYHGIKYLLENRNFSVYYDILDDLMQEPESHRINILMYLSFTLPVDDLFTIYAYEILTKLVKNSRWHDTFIRYFRLLRDHLETNEYLSLIYIVLMEMWIFIEIEGDNGKYNTMWKEFKNIISIKGNHFMKNKYGEEYAKKVFQLFTYQEIKLIELFLSIDDDNANIGNAFYELANLYFNLFAKVYRQCSDNIGIFLMEVIKSEDEISHLLIRLCFTPSEPFCVTELRCIIKDEMQSYLEWYFNMCIVIEEIERFAISEQMSSLKTLIKVEYVEQFLSIMLIDNRLLIFYKQRFVKNIRIYPKFEYTQMFLYLMIKIVNANRF